MKTQYDIEKFSEQYLALIGNQRLNHQFYDMLPIPIEIFKPDGECMFVNRAMMEMLNLSDVNDLVGKYNLKHDPLCLGILGQDLMDSIFRGEARSFDNFPAPINDVANRGILGEKPFEAATMDLFALPLWDGDTFICTITFFTVKNMYHGRADISKAQEYIEAHWLEDFDLDKAAQSVNLSRHHFTRLFKEISGDTPVRYYQKIKIKNIQEKLFNGNLSVEQAFADCGVEYRGAYLRLFKEIVGKTPTEYRKDNNIK